MLKAICEKCGVICDRGYSTMEIDRRKTYTICPHCRQLLEYGFLKDPNKIIAATYSNTYSNAREDIENEN